MTVTDGHKVMMRETLCGFSVSPCTRTKNPVYDKTSTQETAYHQLPYIQTHRQTNNSDYTISSIYSVKCQFYIHSQHKFRRSTQMCIVQCIYFRQSLCKLVIRNHKLFFITNHMLVIVDHLIFKHINKIVAFCFI